MPLPSDETLLAYITSHEGTKALGKRELARAFNIRGDERIAFKAQLGDLAARGLIDKKRKNIQKKNPYPPVLSALINDIDHNGDLIARAELTPKLNEEIKSLPIRIINPIPLHGNQPAGLNDRVLLKVNWPEVIISPVKNKKTNRLVANAKIIKILPKETAPKLGIYIQHQDYHGVAPIEGKDSIQYPVLMPLPEALKDELKNGDLVSYQKVNGGREFQDSVALLERKGNPKSEKAISLIALHHHNIPIEFSKEVLDESESVEAPTPKKRSDFTHLPFITIDPKTAKDHDDAVYACKDETGDNKGGMILYVAIADVSHFVRHDLHMDLAARERGNSVYFPDQVVPMLPERISNDLCSLKENQHRSALVIKMRLNDDGVMIDKKLYRAIIKSHAKLAYEQAQKVFDNLSHDINQELVDEALNPLWDAYLLLKKARDKRAPLALDLPERRLILNDQGEVESVFQPERLEAHRLIEEFMIAANVAAAELLQAKNYPAIYRCHDSPALEKLEGLRDMLDGLGLSIPKGKAVKPLQLNHILKKVEEKEIKELVNESILRAQAQANYSAENIGHFGLNLDNYVHFTSPIRRYADLMIHRFLIHAFKLGDDGLSPKFSEGLGKICEDISGFERRAMVAERDTVDRLISGYLSDQIGTIFYGRISGLASAGLFIRLDHSGADGFVPMRSLGEDYYLHDQNRMRLVGERTGMTYQIGDIVKVNLLEVAPHIGKIRLELIEGGQKKKYSKKQINDMRFSQNQTRAGKRGTRQNTTRRQAKGKTRKRK